MVFCLEEKGVADEGSSSKSVYGKGLVRKDKPVLPLVSTELCQHLLERTLSRLTANGQTLGLTALPHVTSCGGRARTGLSRWLGLPLACWSGIYQTGARSLMHRSWAVSSLGLEG